MVLSRYTDEGLVQCDDCGWRGMVKDCVHTYRGIAGSEGDVEPVDECPECGSDQLIEIRQEPAFAYQ